MSSRLLVEFQRRRTYIIVRKERFAGGALQRWRVWFGFGGGGGASNPLKRETPLTKDTRRTTKVRRGRLFFSAARGRGAERNRAMIRQICGREPPERFKRQTTHGGQFVLFPLFPPARATRGSPREISLLEKTYSLYVAVAALTSNKKVRRHLEITSCIVYATCEDDKMRERGRAP